MESFVDTNVLRGAKILAIEGMAPSSETVTLTTDRGVLRLHHHQDCCESVAVEDVTGDPADLIGANIRDFREDTKDHPDTSESWVQMWTFYNIVTDKADAQIRWCGASNGYYSISVSMEWETTLPPISKCLPPPFAGIRRIDEDGTARNYQGDVLVTLPPESVNNILSAYDLS